MRDCPQCGKPVDGVRCLACGYAEPGAPALKKSAPVRDPEGWRCAWMDRGQRCPEAGGISTGTTGGGPWYCRDHIDAVRSGAYRKAGAVPPPQGFAPLHAIVAGVTSKRDDDAWPEGRE